MKRRHTYQVLVLLVVLVAALLLPGLIQRALHRWQESALLREPMKGRLVRLYMPSRALRRVNKLFVYLPPRYDLIPERLPVVYLLHGMPGEARDWFVKGSAHETAEKLILAGRIRPLILVSFDAWGPGGPRDRTEYLNSTRGGPQVEDYLARELPAWIDAHFRTKPSPRARALVGLSSGGYGAVNVGTKHRDVFSIMASHSGFLDPRVERRYVRRMLGPEGPLWDANTPLEHVSDWRGDTALRIYLDVGRFDGLAAQNHRFAALLARGRIAHAFWLTRGSHHWYVWRRRLPYSLAYIDGCFRQARARRR